MTDMLERSARIIQGSERLEMRGLVNAQASEVAEVAEGVALAESFSNVVAFRTGDGLTVFDVSHELFAPNALAALRRWSPAPVRTVVYTHGHVDHVTGAGVFDADASRAGAPAIRYVGHESVPARFDRYVLTNGYNGVINQRQFRLPEPMFPSEFRYPDEVYREARTLDAAGTTFELHHARGETDDHTWAWVPSHRAICVGDLFIWQFPNAGNPQKVQRYAWDWAVALRAMAALDAELLLPAHGPAIGGARDVRQVLTDTADALESLHTQTLEAMNTGRGSTTCSTPCGCPTGSLRCPTCSPPTTSPSSWCATSGGCTAVGTTGTPRTSSPPPTSTSRAKPRRLRAGRRSSQRAPSSSRARATSGLRAISPRWPRSPRPTTGVCTRCARPCTTRAARPRFRSWRAASTARRRSNRGSGRSDSTGDDRAKSTPAVPRR